MRKTAKIILTTIPAKTIMSNTFEFLIIDFPLIFHVRQRILNNIMGISVSRNSLIRSR
jgi:hypothetical protein